MGRILRAGNGIAKATASKGMVAKDRLYLDYNAGAPLHGAVRQAMAEALLLEGNPSSVHAEGRAQRHIVENARQVLADHLGVAPKQVIFTSGASEAAMHALSPRMRKGIGEIRCSHLYVSAIEHPCVLSGGRFTEGSVSRVPVTAGGVIDLSALDALLAAHGRSDGIPLVALMLANNETGVIQPVAEAGEIARRHGGLLLVDAVQGLGRMPVGPAVLGADFVILSAHKAGGPKGAGALVLGNAGLSPVPLILGGGQENYHRAGTENVAAIAGFAAAVENLPSHGAWRSIENLRDLLSEGLHTISVEAGAAAPVVFGAGEKRLANTLCFAVPGIRAETALISLDLAGIAASSGSACSSGKVKKSHVLEAMSVRDDLAACALRTSFGPSSTAEDVTRFLTAWRDIVGRMARFAA
jgi:cysteine desulfurase